MRLRPPRIEKALAPFRTDAIPTLTTTTLDITPSKLLSTLKTMAVVRQVPALALNN